MPLRGFQLIISIAAIFKPELPPGRVPGTGDGRPPAALRQPCQEHGAAGQFPAGGIRQRAADDDLSACIQRLAVCGHHRHHGKGSGRQLRRNMRQPDASLRNVAAEGVHFFRRYDQIFLPAVHSDFAGVTEYDIAPAFSGSDEFFRSGIGGSIGIDPPGNAVDKLCSRRKRTNIPDQRMVVRLVSIRRNPVTQRRNALFQQLIPEYERGRPHMVEHHLVAHHIPELRPAGRLRRPAVPADRAAAVTPGEPHHAGPVMQRTVRGDLQRKQ